VVTFVLFSSDRIVFNAPLGGLLYFDSHLFFFSPSALDFPSRPQTVVQSGVVEAHTGPLVLLHYFLPLLHSPAAILVSRALMTITPPPPLLLYMWPITFLSVRAASLPVGGRRSSRSPPSLVILPFFLFYVLGLCCPIPGTTPLHFFPPPLFLRLEFATPSPLPEMSVSTIGPFCIFNAGLGFFTTPAPPPPPPRIQGFPGMLARWVSSLPFFSPLRIICFLLSDTFFVLWGWRKVYACFFPRVGPSTFYFTSRLLELRQRRGAGRSGGPWVWLVGPVVVVLGLGGLWVGGGGVGWWCSRWGLIPAPRTLRAQVASEAVHILHSPRGFFRNMLERLWM